MASAESRWPFPMLAGTGFQVAPSARNTRRGIMLQLLHHADLEPDARYCLYGQTIAGMSKAIKRDGKDIRNGIAGLVETGYVEYIGMRYPKAMDTRNQACKAYRLTEKGIEEARQINWELSKGLL